MILAAAAAAAAAAAPPPAGIASHQLLVFLLQVGGLLGLAVLLGILASRLGMAAVVGELLAGVLLGPSLLKHVAPGLSGWLLPATASQMHLLDAVGQVGVLLLVGIAGIHLDLGILKRRRNSIAAVGSGALLVPLALGLAAGLVLPNELRTAGTDRLVFALFIGVAICVSAIPVIASTLIQLDLFDREVGQLIMGSAAVDDVVGWLLLALVSATATTGLGTSQVVRPVCYLIAILLGTVLIGRPVVRLVMRLAANSGSPAASVSAAVVVLLLCGAATQSLGMEPILGTFLGGMLIGTCGTVDLELLAPLRTFVLSVLAPIFFATAGLRMDLTALGRPVVLASAGAVLALAVFGKFTGAYVGARASRLDHWTGIALGAGLNARGVVEVVVAMVGLQVGILTTASYTVIVLIAIVTSLMAPPLLRYAVRRMPPSDTPGQVRAARLATTSEGTVHDHL
jgi:Kef-type K+ transport system membrane component KefB